MTIMKTMRAVSFGLFCVLIAHSGVQAESVNNDRAYKTPEEAVTALVAAVQANDETEMLAILGMTKDAVASGDEIADKAERAAFLASYEARRAIVLDKEGRRAILEIGEQSWPFPVPLTAKPKDGQWAFDGPAGIETIIDRRIGRNELSAEQVLLAYVDAQRDYYRLNPEKAMVPHFAQRIASQPGKRDGLYWQTGPDQPQSPLGPLIAQAGHEGYQPIRQGEDRPYHGYRYRVLTAQGPHAEGGAYDYIQNGLMFGGFGLIAYPETYGVSGVMTFIVNQDGAIYEKNLGKETSSLVQKITRFDPDATWSLVELPSEE